MTVRQIPSLYKLDYKDSLIILFLLIYLFLYLSIIIEIFKCYILIRKIDDSIRSHYISEIESAKSNISIYDKLKTARIMTSFDVSDNFLSDFILSGNQRHPSIRRLFIIQFILAFFSIIIISLIFRDINKTYLILTIKYNYIILLFLGIILNLVIQYILIKYYFVKRSAFIHHSEIGYRTFIEYFKLVSSIYNLNSNIQTNFNSGNEVELINKAMEKLNECNYLSIGNIFDNNLYIDFLSKNINQIKYSWNQLSKEQQEKIDSVKVDFGFILDISGKFKVLNNLYEDLTTSSDYDLALNYHKRFFENDHPYNILTFIYLAFKDAKYGVWLINKIKFKL